MVSGSAENPGSDDFVDVNLLHVWRMFLRRRYLILAIAFVVAGIAAAASYLVKPVYRADVLLASAAAQEGDSPLGSLLGQYSGLASLAGMNIKSGAAQSVDESIAILKSRAFTQKFIETLGLMPVLFSDPKQTAADGKPPSMWDAYKRFDTMRKVSKDAETSFFKLGIEWSDPAVAAVWANTMVQMLNEHLRQKAIQEAERSIAYLQEQLEKTAVVERRQMLINLMEAETRKIVLAKSRDEYAVRVLDQAVAPKEKVRPQRAVITIAGFIVGLIGGLVAAILLEVRR